MKVFVTGSTGLLGNNLVRSLVENGHTVVGLSTHTVDLGQYVGQNVRAQFQNQPEATGVTRSNAITRPIQNFVRKVRELPVLNFFK